MLRSLRRSSQVDMIHEKPLWAFLWFTFPLLLGNLLQQMYSTVDSIVVGNLVGKDALAAVGAGSSITSLMLSFFSGISAGASIVVSNIMGKKEEKSLERLTHTLISLALLAGAILGALGWALTPRLLTLLRVPAGIRDLSGNYMSISLAGIGAVMLFNILNGILHGLGNARTPMMILGLCSVLNIVLDILFVAVGHWSVAGVAWATLIAQLLSAAFGALRLNRIHPAVRLKLSRLRIHWKETKNVLRIGMPAAVQHSMNAVGNLIVQSVLNQFGETVIAANVAVMKVDSICVLPMLSFATAITVFTGQNAGANQPGRIRQGARVAVISGMVMAAAVTLVLLFLGPALLGLFIRPEEDEVIRAGMEKIRIIAPFYCCMGLANILAGVIRGIGNTLAPMMIGLTAMFLGRVPVSMLLSQRIGANGVHWSLAVEWAVEAVLMLGFFLFVRRKLAKESPEAK